MFSFFKKSKVPATLIPRVRPLWWFESYAFNTFTDFCEDMSKEQYLGISDAYYRPYEADLGVGFCIYDGKKVEIVKNCDVEDWGESYQKLLKKATDNILQGKSLFKSAYKGVWQSTLNNTCDSSVMLLKDKIKKLELESQPVLFFPSRECTLIAGASDTEGLNFCMHVVTDFAENREFLTTNSYSLENNVWIKVGLTGDHEIANKYKEFVFKEKQQDTNEFLANLEHLFGEDDLFISRYNYLKEEGGDYHSFACWMAFRRNWVPKVDRIILVSPESTKSPESEKNLQESTFDWDIVTSICSARMRKLQYHHEIWEFEGFPAKEEITRMKALQKNVPQS